MKENNEHVNNEPKRSILPKFILIGCGVLLVMLICGATIFGIFALIGFRVSKPEEVSFSDSDLKVTMNQMALLEEEFDTYMDSGEDPEKLAQEFAQWLAEQPQIEVSGTSPDGYGVWWKFKESGILGALSNAPDGLRADGDETPSDTVDSPSTQEYNASGTNAIYLGPYLHDFGSQDDYNGLWTVISESECPKFNTTDLKDEEVTPTHFKNLDQYDVIVITTHGDVYFEGEVGGKEGVVALYTYTKLTTDNYEEYYPELMRNRLALTDGGKLLVLPSYIEEYNSDFTGAIVFLGACRSTYNTTLSDVFMYRGADAVFGFNEYVQSSYAKKVSTEMFQRYVKKEDDIFNAYLNATGMHGENDFGYRKAKFDMLGLAESALDRKSCTVGSYSGKATVKQQEFYGCSYITKHLELDIRIQDSAVDADFSIEVDPYRKSLANSTAYQEKDCEDPLYTSAWISGSGSGPLEGEMAFEEYTTWEVNGIEFRGEYFTIDLSGDIDYTHYHDEEASSGIAAVSITGVVEEDKITAWVRSPDLGLENAVIELNSN